MLSAPESLALFGVGLLSAFLPGSPPSRVDPQLVLTLLLPPLIYASTVRVSWRLLRFMLLPGVVLGTLLVLTTIGVVAAAVRFLFLPGLSWTASLLLGVVAAVFDTRLFHEAKGRPHVPRPSRTPSRRANSSRGSPSWLRSGWLWRTPPPTKSRSG